MWPINFGCISCADYEDPGMLDPIPEEDVAIFNAVPEERFVQWGKEMRGQSRINVAGNALQRKTDAWKSYFEEMKRVIRLARSRVPGVTQVNGWTDAATSSGAYPETISVFSMGLCFVDHISMF
jgi:hypothetical protein